MRGGLPHSEIFGSQGAPASPKLIAGCHVLHRLSVPRHPPNALLIRSRTRSIPMRRHTFQMSENRSQMSDSAFCLICVIRYGNPLIRTHTVVQADGREQRTKIPEASALRASHPLQDPYSIRQLTPLPHRTAIGPAHRRLPKPSSRFQEPDAGEQMPDDRHRSRTPQQ